MKNVLSKVGLDVHKEKVMGGDHACSGRPNLLLTVHGHNERHFQI